MKNSIIILPVVFVLFCLSLIVVSADDFKPPTYYGTSLMTINSPTNGTAYTGDQKIIVDYTFDKYPESYIFLLDINLLDEKLNTVTSLAKDLDTTTGEHNFSFKFPKTTTKGTYYVQYNETRNTGVYWSTMYLISNIKVTYSPN